MVLLRIFCLLLVFGTVYAQEFRATLQGDVTDPTHARVPKATVALKNTETGIERTVVTDDGGHYLFQFVPPGKYTLSVSAPGFKTAGRSGIELMTGFGTEFFIPGIESLGFAVETGGTFDNLTGSFILRTLGVSFLDAGIHFYF